MTSWSPERYRKGLPPQRYEATSSSMLAQGIKAMKPKCKRCDVELVELSDAERRAVKGVRYNLLEGEARVICTQCNAVHHVGGNSELSYVYRVWDPPGGYMYIVDGKVLWWN